MWAGGGSRPDRGHRLPSTPPGLGSWSFGKVPRRSGQGSGTRTPSLPCVRVSFRGASPSVDYGQVEPRGPQSAPPPPLTLQGLPARGLPAGHSLQILQHLLGPGGGAVATLQQARHQSLAGGHLLAAHLHLVLKLCKLGTEVLRRRKGMSNGGSAGKAASAWDGRHLGDG